MAAKQQPRLRRVLGRFRRNELSGAVQWLLGSDDTPRRCTKRDIVASTLEACAEIGVSEHTITELELKYILTHPDSLQWKGYRLTYANAWVPSMSDTDLQMFCKRFQVYLSHLDCDLADTLKSPHHWLALHIAGQSSGRASSYTCYIVRCPLTPCVLLAGVRKPHLSTLLDEYYDSVVGWLYSYVVIVPLVASHMARITGLAQDVDKTWHIDALCLTIGCSRWKDMELCGKSLNSLLDLMLNQSSQGPYSAYRLNQKDPNPLLAVRRKRRRQNQGSTEVLSERQKKLKASAESVFGTNPLPKLEKFTFKIEAPLMDTEEVINCSVKLSGTDVARGVKQYIMSGMVTLPVPDILAALHSSSSNNVTVRNGTTVDHRLPSPPPLETPMDMT